MAPRRTRGLSIPLILPLTGLGSEQCLEPLSFPASGVVDAITLSAPVASVPHHEPVGCLWEGLPMSVRQAPSLVS